MGGSSRGRFMTPELPPACSSARARYRDKAAPAIRPQGVDVYGWRKSVVYLLADEATGRYGVEDRPSPSPSPFSPSPLRRKRLGSDSPV
jgi:hypothetical protein